LISRRMFRQRSGILGAARLQASRQKLGYTARDVCYERINIIT
jgi:hypothetical protein